MVNVHVWFLELDLSFFSPPQGVSTSVLCRDVAWLTEELLFRNKDVGFGGSLTEVVHYSLSLLAPHLIIAAAPSKSVSCHKRKMLMSCCSSIIHSTFLLFFLLVHTSPILGKTHWLCPVLLLLPHFTSPTWQRRSHTPLSRRLLGVSDFEGMRFM